VKTDKERRELELQPFQEEYKSKREREIDAEDSKRRMMH